MSFLAGSGLGRLLANRFAKLGCHLVLWDMNSDANEETGAQCREFGVHVNTYTCDLSQREEVYTAANKVHVLITRFLNFAAQVNFVCHMRVLRDQ
jgi:short-subunit dehydrogenase